MEEIRLRIGEAVGKLYRVEILPEVTPAPANVEADYSSNIALKLAKNLHKAPIEIAEEIRQRIEQDTEAFQVMVTAPGFINFISPDEYLLGKLGELAGESEENYSSGEYSGKTVICEFSDPNPFKVLHVGHLYTSIVGNAIANLFERAGAKVVRANFGGDVGLHVAKTMYALGQKLGVGGGNCEKGGSENGGGGRGKNAEKQSRRDEAGVGLGSEDEFEAKIRELQIEDIAKNYVEGTRKYEEDAEAKKQIDELNQEIYRINKEKRQDSEVAKLYWRGRELSYEYFDQFYARIGVHFDKYYPESAVAELGLKTVLRELDAGVYEKSEGAVVFNGEKYGLHTRVFVNALGVPTYEAKDVGLIFTKWEDYKFDKSVVITGNEQLDYMKVVLKSVEQYAPELVERTAHLTHGLVKLPGNVKMASRKGNFLRAVEVLDLVSEELFEEYQSRDFKVALSAVKYAFLKYKMGGDIIFDPRESVKMTGNSGPYLLYSCVRAKKILGRGTASGNTVSAPLITEERGLILKILEYRGVLEEATREMAPHKIAGYLYELAQEFSRFYEKCPVVGSEREGLRLEIVRAYLMTMEQGLSILGIEVPEEM